MLSFNNVLPSALIAFTTKRSVDFSKREDQGELTSQQKAFLSSCFNIPMERLIQVNQVHGDEIIFVGPEFEGNGFPYPMADSIFTHLTDIPLVIRTADCLPVFLYNTFLPFIGLVHAGWRGSRCRIIDKTLVAIHQRLNADHSQTQAVLGPCIRSCCYEVGVEFRSIFPEETVRREGRYFLDLAAVNKHQLARQGVKDENIYDCGVCTCCDSQYFSYRREADKAGRMLSLIMLKEK